MDSITKEKIKFIKNFLKKKKRKPLIIVFSGIYGAGKTTLSYRMAKIFNIKHRTDVGPIVWSIKSLFLNRSNLVKDLRWIDSLTIDQRRMKSQSKLICQVINNMIISAQKFGKDYFLEGVQILPQFLKMENILCYIFLKTPPFQIYKKRLNQSETHFLRRFSFNHVLFFQNKLEKFLLNLISSYRKKHKKERDKVIIIQEKNMNEKIKKVIDIIYNKILKNKCGVV